MAVAVCFRVQPDDLTGHRHAHLNASAAAGLTIDDKLPAEQRGTLTHAAKAEPTAPVGTRAYRRGVEAVPIVDDAEAEVIVARRELDPNACGAGMPANVDDRLLGDAIERRFNPRRVAID